MATNTSSKSEPLVISSDLVELNNTVDDATFSFDKNAIEKPRKVVLNKEYDLHSVHSTIEEAEKIIADGISDTTWRILRNTNTTKGMTRFYCCNMGSRKKGMCPKNLKLLINWALYCNDKFR